MSTRQPVQIWDTYHCTGCNAKLGQRIVYTDGSEENLCDCHVTCFDLFMTHPSYEIEVYNRDDEEGRLAAIKTLDDMALQRK